MQRRLAMHLNPKCGAHSRRSGKPCRNGAMKNGRCRMHGGKSTGAPKGNRNALKHGNYSAKEQARRVALILGDGGPVYQEIVKLLLAGGAKAEIADNDGVTSLAHAKSRGFNEIARMIEQR